MGTTEGVEISYDVPPYIRVYADGTIQRLAGTEFAPAAFDPATGVSSKDVVIDPETGVFARIYRPNAQKKLPLVVYFHGGAFFLSSVGDPNYHGFLNVFVAKVNVILVSVNYRKAPEHPLPTAYEDSWVALQWIIASRNNIDWLMDSVLDFNRVFLAGDSAGANISHHVAIKSTRSDPNFGLKFSGIIMIHPYFWGEIPIGIEVEDQTRKAMVDKWWEFVCPSKEGNKDSLINPFVNGISVLEDLACDRIIVCVAGKDILRERGKLYYESLVKSEWRGKAEIIETEDEDHVFHIFDPRSDNAVHLVESLDAFINQNC